MADLLASHPDPAVRDAQIAIEIIEHIANISDYKNVEHLLILSADNASNHQYKKTLAIVSEAITLPETKENP
jgi:hypothetical protein